MKPRHVKKVEMKSKKWFLIKKNLQWNDLLFKFPLCIGLLQTYASVFHMLISFNINSMHRSQHQMHFASTRWEMLGEEHFDNAQKLMIN